MKTLRRAISSRDGLIWAAALLLLTVCLPGYSAVAEGLIEPSGLQMSSDLAEPGAPHAQTQETASPPAQKEEALKIHPATSEKPLPQPIAQQPGGERKPTPVKEAPKVAEPLTSGSAEQQITAPPSVSPKIPADNKRLSLDFKGADLDDLLRLISEVSSLNIVAAHGLKERKDRDVTVRLINVEWRQALDVILRAKGLSYEQDGNVLYVGSKAEIQKGKEERAKDIEAVEPPCTKVIHLAHTKAPDVKKHLDRLKTRLGSVELDEGTNTVIVNDVQSACLKMAAVASELDTPPKDPFMTKLLQFNYAKAADLKTHLAALKTPQGSIVIDERSSRIIVKDLPETVERLETFLKQIDIPTPQVLIEARIVEASRAFSQSIGIQWGGTAGSSTGGTVFGGGSGQTIQFPGTTPTSGPVPLALNLPAAAPQFVLGATFASLADRFLVGVQLSAAEREGKIKTLSSPRVATQDNEEAEIKQGTQVPYTTIDSSGRTVVQFQDAFIKLKVKPHITPDGRVSMKVEAERSFPGDRVDFKDGFVFPINTRKATTNILVQNGSTVVIGGLLQSTESLIMDQVPFLGRIPGLGWLFKRRSLGPDERVELLIFLTPSVLRESRL